MIDHKQCPCHNCICMPICRHKPYFELFKCAILIEWHLVFKSDPIYRYVMWNSLNPTRWNVDNEGRLIQLKDKELW